MHPSHYPMNTGNHQGYPTSANTTTPDLQRYSQGSWGTSPHASGTAPLFGRPTVLSSAGTQGGQRSTCRRSEALPRISMALHSANLFAPGSSGTGGGGFATRATVGYVEHERDGQDSPALLWAGRPTMNFHPGGGVDEDGGEVGRHTTLTYGGDSNERSGTLGGSARFSGSATNVFGPPTAQLPPPPATSFTQQFAQDGNSQGYGFAPVQELDGTMSGAGGGTQTQAPLAEDVLAELESAPRKSYMKDGADDGDHSDTDMVLSDWQALPPTSEETFDLPGFAQRAGGCGWHEPWGGGADGEEQTQDLRSLTRTVCAKTLAFRRSSVLGGHAPFLPEHADPSLPNGDRANVSVDYLREEVQQQQQQAADDVVEQLQHLTMHASPTQKRLAFDDEPSQLNINDEEGGDGGEEAPRTARSSAVGPLVGGNTAPTLSTQQGSRNSVLPNFRFPPQKRHKLTGMALLQSRKRCLQEMLEDEATVLPEAEAPTTDDVLSCTVTSTASSSGHTAYRNASYVPVSSVLEVCRASGSSTNKESQALQCAPLRRSPAAGPATDHPLSVYAMCKRFRKEKLNAQCHLVNHSFPPMHSGSASFGGSGACPLPDHETATVAHHNNPLPYNSSTIASTNTNEGRGSAAPSFLTPRNTNLPVPMACHSGGVGGRGSCSHANNDEEGGSDYSPSRWRESGRRPLSASPAERHARVRSCGDFL